MLIEILEIIVSVLIIVLVLMQERGSGLSGVFGGSGEGSYQTRRGVEKFVFIATIVATIAFITLAIIKILAR